MPNTAARQGQLDDTTLLTRLNALVAQDRKTSARMLWHLAEVDARGLYRDEGYSSLFDYCVKSLRMSEGEASLRIRAARLSRRFPGVLSQVERGELHLSALRVLAPVLTEDNHRALLASATHKTKRQVEQMLADMAPAPDAKSVIRKLPTRESRESSKPLDLGGRSGQLNMDRQEQAPAQLPCLAMVEHLPARSLPSRAQQGSSVPAVPEHREHGQHGSRSSVAARDKAHGNMTPLGAQRYKVQFTASEQLHEQLRQAQDLMRHQVPDGDLATIVGKAMTLLVTQLKKQRFGHRTRPRKSAREKAAPRPQDASTSALDKPPRAPKGNEQATKLRSSPGRTSSTATNQLSRHIPAEVRRAVVERDGGRCTFVSASVGGSGHRCEATGMLEFHHEDPYAKGGLPTVDNVRLLCRSHNALLAERDFGRDFILRKRRGKHVNHPTVPEPVPS